MERHAGENTNSHTTSQMAFSPRSLICMFPDIIFMHVLTWCRTAASGPCQKHTPIPRREPISATEKVHLEPILEKLNAAYHSNVSFAEFYEAVNSFFGLPDPMCSLDAFVELYTQYKEYLVTWQLVDRPRPDNYVVAVTPTLSHRYDQDVLSEIHKYSFFFDRRIPLVPVVCKPVCTAL